jgi:ATP-binding cassette subfamily C protein CydCD
MKPLDPRLLRHASAARRFVILAAATAVLTAGLVLVQAQLLASGRHPALSSVARRWRDLAPVLVALLVVVACRAALAWLAEVAAHRASTDVIRQLRSKLVTHALRLGPRHGGLPPTGELATLATRGLDGLEGYFSRYLPTLLVAAVVPAVVACRILFADLLSGVIVGLTVPLIPIFMILVGLHTQRSTRRQWRALAVLGHHFLDLVAGLDVLVAFGRAPHQSSRLRTLATEYRRATMQTLRVAFLSALVLELLATLSVALIAVSVGLRLVEGRLDLFTGLVVLILAPEVYLPLRAVGARFHDSAEGLAAASEASRCWRPRRPAVPVGSRRPTRPGSDPPGRRGGRGPFGPDPRRAGPAAGAGHRARRARAQRQRQVDAGRPAARLAHPDEGRVLVGGVDLADVDRDAWLRRIAWVPQRPTLVRGTVADNIRLGQPFATTERVTAAAEAAALDIPLDTPVGEDGNGLSTGQQRRVALARAVLADRPLLLLDEPTEGVDADTEASIIAALGRVTVGRTVVLVSHRPELLAVCDRLLTIDPVLAPAAPDRHPIAPDGATGTGGACTPCPQLPSSPTPTRSSVGALRWSLAAARGQRGRLALAALLGALALGCGVALTATSAWLIPPRPWQPPVLALMVAIVAVRAFGLGKGVLRYAERLLSHDAALRAGAALRERIWHALVRLGPAATARLRRGELLARSSATSTPSRTC